MAEKYVRGLLRVESALPTCDVMYASNWSGMQQGFGFGDHARRAPPETVATSTTTTNTYNIARRLSKVDVHRCKVNGRMRDSCRPVLYIRSTHAAATAFVCRDLETAFLYRLVFK